MPKNWIINDLPEYLTDAAKKFAQENLADGFKEFINDDECSLSFVLDHENNDIFIRIFFDEEIPMIKRSLTELIDKHSDKSYHGIDGSKFILSFLKKRVDVLEDYIKRHEQ